MTSFAKNQNFRIQDGRQTSDLKIAFFRHVTIGLLQYIDNQSIGRNFHVYRFCCFPDIVFGYIRIRPLPNKSTQACAHGKKTSLGGFW